MTRERLKTALEDACFHVPLKRLYDEQTRCWTCVWTCADCGASFFIDLFSTSTRPWQPSAKEFPAVD